MTLDPSELICNVHEPLLSEVKSKSYNVQLVKRDYAYYHYSCDGLNDSGWGCGYRTCQTICSWIHFQTVRKTMESSRNSYEKISGVVPSIPEIQDILVQLGDKPPNFKGSKEWIGSFEIALCIDGIYGTPCRLVHVSPGQLGNHIQSLSEHFEKYGCPAMMGGDSDNASKGILGVATDPENSVDFLLILDPHCCEKPYSARDIAENGLVSWKRVSDFDENSFYNICLPRVSYA